MLDFSSAKARVAEIPAHFHAASVSEVRGPIVICGRLPATIGTEVVFEFSGTPNPAAKGACLHPVPQATALGEIVGFSGDSSFIAPYSNLQGISPDMTVRVLGRRPWMLDGSVLGAMLDSRGRHLSRLASPSARFLACPKIPASRRNLPPPPASRKPADAICATGIRAIDGFATLAHGQRIAVFAEPGVGKSTLISSIAKNAAVDVTVVALVGERGREVGEFIQRLDPQAAERCAVVQATSDQPAVCRINTALSAMRIAEYFRDQGLSVLLLVDSLTRLLRAYRELGLAAGEMPVRRGYPPSIFSALPELIERAGCGERGSITAVFTVLLSAETEQDPMVEEVTGLMDGHLILSRELAEAGVFPAVDPVRSLSRLQRDLITADQHSVILRLRAAVSRARRDRELAALGGAIDAQLARAFRIEEQLRLLLSQTTGEFSEFEETMARLAQIDCAP